MPHGTSALPYAQFNSVLAKATMNACLKTALHVHQATYAKNIDAACAIQKHKMDMTAASLVTVVLATAHGHTVISAQR
jgi:hypothetical protein